MRSRWKPLRDLALVEPAAHRGWQVWDSTGDDPGFQFSLPFFRSRYIVIAVESLGGALDPRLYVDYGLGLSERNALAPQSGKSHVILVDVGFFGQIRALRFDPATFPVRFQFAVQFLSRLEDAEALASQWRRLMEAKAPINRFTNLVGFGFGRKKRASPFASVSTAQYARGVYDLARRTTYPAASDATAWLSIVVPTYNTPARYLNQLLKSFQRQDTGGVELILSDDGSTATDTLRWLERRRGDRAVRVVRSETNGGIAAATNAGLRMATAPWVTFLDHDDVIAPYALRMIRQALDDNPEAELLYTDELVVNDRLKPTGQMLKPAYDPVLLSGVNYINHFSVYRRERLLEIGGMRSECDGSQDYDCLLRYLAGVEDHQVLHLPYPAYWWRRTGQTFSVKHLEKATLSARKALTEVFGGGRRSVFVEAALTPALHRVEFDVGDAALPMISIIVPTKNAFDLISRLLGDLFERTDYPNFEVILVDNGSTEKAVLELYERTAARHENFVADVRTAEFNFSRAVNRGLALAKGEHFLLVNNDIEVTRPSWLREMVQCLNFEGVGIVGAKLLYPNDTIQHAGVIVGFGGLAGHWYHGKLRDFPGPMGRLHVRTSMSCVTAAMMLISGECRQAVGDFDEVNFAVAYNDVDYCMRAYGAGFRTLWTPFACLYHHESATRGPETLPHNIERFEREKANLRRIHETASFLDPAISPFNGREHSDPSLKRPEALPEARRWFRQA